MDRRKNRRKTNSYKGVNTIILEFFVSKLSKKIIKMLDKRKKYDIIISVTRRRQTSHLIQRKKVIQK